MPYFRNLKEKIEAEFGESVIVVEKKDSRITGNFEVKILNSGELIYSRKKKGQDRCEKNEEVANVLEKIRISLSS
jgi:hypothetical protein